MMQLVPNTLNSDVMCPRPWPATHASTIVYIDRFNIDTRISIQSMFLADNVHWTDLTRAS